MGMPSQTADQWALINRSGRVVETRNPRQEMTVQTKQTGAVRVHPQNKDPMFKTELCARWTKKATCPWGAGTLPAPASAIPPPPHSPPTRLPLCSIPNLCRVSARCRMPVCPRRERAAPTPSPPAQVQDRTVQELHRDGQLPVRQEVLLPPH